ncbi:MAG: gliding motility-associated C-terminal domain-containing protein [Crocinitomicaceae bacterium]|nr:gliding motility-associated C-terminal domain-containing protein [Crocinitomicaceae bacterium]
MIKIFSSIMLLAVSVLSFGQILYNNNGSIFVASGGVVQVNGSAQNAAGTLENNGTTNITNDYVNDASTYGTGEYYVQGNWENNGAFTAFTSHVYLDGAAQQITGLNITTFYNLTTTGSGIKSQTIDARVSNNLNLTTVELATLGNTMFVDNVNANAISFSTGFVSSDVTTGRLDRATQSASTYIFPTGSSQGTMRYRPVQITPLNASSNRYAVRFANVTGTSEGYNLASVDTSICEVEPDWFHIITRPSGSTDAAVTIFYDQGNDGTWAGFAQWNAGPTQWQNVGTVTAGTPTPIENYTKAAWNDWTDDPYALVNLNPLFDVTGIDATTCNTNNGQLVFTNLTPSTTYSVTYDSSGVAVGPISATTNGSGQFTITTGAGTYTNITVTGSGCNYTHWSTIVIDEPASPTPTITGTLNYCPGNSASLSTGSFASYSWSTGDNTQTTTATIADNPITVTVTDANGCTGTSAPVNVIEDANPDPGTNGSTSVCSNATTIDLFNFLGGSPDAGGTWSPALTSGTGVFDPTQDAAGTYTYSLNACGGGTLTADVVVSLNPAADPGTNGAITMCPTDPSTDLFNELGGSPDAGGTWAPAMTSGTGVFDPTQDAAGVYTYSVTNACGTESATVTVTITSSPYSGMDGSVTLCPSDAPTDLFTALGGADAGGTWSPALTSGTGVFDPSQDAAGTYTYSLNACGGGTVSSDIVVTINPAPNAGTSGAVTYCDSDASSDLFAQLGGTPDAGGSWSPTLTSGTGVFDPTQDAAGTYTYSVVNSCGSATANVVVTVNNCGSVDAGFTMSASSLCLGDCITFTDTSLGNPTTWLWNFGGAVSPNTTADQNPTICPTAIGTYTIMLVVSDGTNNDTTTQVINVYETPTVDAGIDTTITVGDQITIYSNTSSAGGLYSWVDPNTVDCSDCASINVSPEETTTYILTYTTVNGCSASDSVIVTVFLDEAIGVPNGFSPNGDSNNDVLYVKGSGISSMSFAVYNRYGQKVFETTNPAQGWDGTYKDKPENPGVFVWYLEYTLTDGTSDIMKGNVTLIK